MRFESQKGKKESGNVRLLKTATLSPTLIVSLTYSCFEKTYSDFASLTKRVYRNAVQPLPPSRRAVNGRYIVDEWPRNVAH